MGTDARFSLAGQAAIVTGASSGLGEMMARGLAQAGCAVLLAARREGELARVAGAFEDVLRVNVGAQAALAAAAARAMIDAGAGGWMILMSSILGRKAGTGPGVAAYASSKIAVEGLTRELARQWAPHGIRVNALAPGYFPTEMNAPMTADPGRRAALVARIPLGRAGEPDDIAGVAVFLASAAAGYLTGQVLPLDGGMSIW